MRKSIRDPKIGPDQDPEGNFKIRRQISLIRTKKKGFPHDWGRTYEKFFFSKFLNLSSRKNLQYKISHFYTDFWKKIVVSPDHTCAFMYHSPWQPALVLMSTSLFDYYFLSLPGFEPGYLFQRAWIVSTRPLWLTAGWSFWYILLLSTYLQVTQRYTHNKRQVRILLSPPLSYMMYIDAWKIPFPFPAHPP